METNRLLRDVQEEIRQLRAATQMYAAVVERLLAQGEQLQAREKLQETVRPPDPELTTWPQRQSDPAREQRKALMEAIQLAALSQDANYTASAGARLAR